MAEYYPYIILALLLIYSHQIKAPWLQTDPDVIWRGLKAEQPSCAKRLFGDPEVDTFWLIDAISYLEGRGQRRALCKLVMEHMIREGKGDDFVEFEKVKCTLAVPRMAPSWMWHVPRNVMIGHKYSYYRSMMWCRPRRYRKRVNGQIVSDQIQGFFLSGSIKDKTKIFVFRPATMEGRIATPVAQLNGYVRKRFKTRGSSSSTEEDPERIARTTRPGTPSPERESTANQMMLLTAPSGSRGAALVNQGSSSSEESSSEESSSEESSSAESSSS